MRRISLLTVYLAAVFGGGALLAPWLYWLARWGAAHWAALAGLANNPFPRFVLRAMLGLAVVLLWPLLRACGMLGAREIGLAKGGRPARNAAAGFAIGFASLAFATALAVVCGGRTPNLSRSGPELFYGVLGATATAVVVALIEELIFRGALFGILRKTCAWPAALAASSAVYAAVHFLQKAGSPQTIDWLSGIRTLPELFRIPAEGFAPAFFTLLLAGAILALVYQRTGTLFMSIGLHAGWIFWLSAYRLLTREAPAGTRAIWGSDKLIDGWLPFLILTLVLAVMWRAGQPAAGSECEKCS
jgi:membrane protease YdiL (CAAX protease family)